jgi:MFS family permease
MGSTGTGERAKRAGRSVFTASQRVGRAGAATAGGAGRFVHRLTSASGAGRTGLSTLIELTAAGGFADAFVAVALAGTLFFSASLDQARGRVALALLVTIAPYAILAPLIGPLLDRVKQGNRYILAGTLFARCLLCWGMVTAAYHNDAVTLLPAAFGVLVLQKAYGVTRAAVTPRLLPSEIPLVTANARLNLGSIIAASTGAVVALGIDKLAGDHGGGAAWVLGFATAIYLAAAIFGLRLPARVDAMSDEDQDAAPDPGGEPGQTLHAGNGAAPASADGQRGPGGTWVFESAAPPGDPTAGAQTLGGARPRATGGGSSAGRKPSRLRHMFTPPSVGPVVREAMEANASIRVFYGFMLFFLAFVLRSEHFGHTSYKIALGGFAAAIAIGGVLGTLIGSALKARAPQVLMFTVLALATLVSIACAMFFGLWSVLAVALAAAISQTLVKVALDSIVQREIPPETRSSGFAFSETVHQLALVAGGLIGLLLSLTGSGFAGLTVAAIGLALALVWLVASRRRRILRARQASPGPAL